MPNTKNNAPLGPLDLAALEQKEILAHVKDLLENNYRSIVDNCDESGNLHANFRVSVLRGEDPCIVKVAVSIPVPAIKDDIETTINPNQTELPLEL